MNRIYFFGIIQGIGLFSFIASIILFFVYIFKFPNISGIIGCIMANIFSIILLNIFTEKRALK